MGKRTSLLSLANEKTENIPGQSDPVLLPVSLDKLVATRFNPRRDFGTTEELQAFGNILAKKQLQPAVAVTRGAYLKLWPEEAEAVGAATHVVANGERRLRASQAVERPTLEIVVRDDIATSRATFLDAVLSENIDRADLNPIERAFAIETMVQELGGADAVAEHYDKTKGWVSQQRSLLKLSPETQSLVAAGEMPVRFARSISTLAPAEQLEAWEQEQAEAAQRALERKARAKTLRAKKTPPSPPTPRGEDSNRFTAVNHGGAEQPEGEPSGDTSVAPDSFGSGGSNPEPTLQYPAMAQDPGQSLPEPRGGGAPAPADRGSGPQGGQQTGAIASPTSPGSTVVAAMPSRAEVVQLRANDSATLMDAARKDLEADEFSAFLQRYFQITSGVDEVVEHLGRGLPTGARRGLADILRSVADRLSVGS